MPYLYESHLSGLYTSDEQIDFDDLYCEECGGSDWEVSEYKDLQDLWELVKGEASIFETGGYALSHIATFFCDKPQEELEEMDDFELLVLIGGAIKNETMS